MSLELILIAVLGLVVLALAALVWMLWQRPTPADSSQDVAALKARVTAFSTPDLGTLHQMVSRLETELAELKSTPWRGHPARADAESRPIEFPSPDSGEGQGGGASAEEPDAAETPAVQGSPLLRPEDSIGAGLGGGGEGLGERSSGELPISVPSPDSGECQGVGVDLQTGGSPDAGRLPEIRMTLDEATMKTEELLNQTDNPTDRAYLTGLHERLVNANRVQDFEEWDNDRTLIFGLYQQVSDIGAHELSDDLRPTAKEIAGVLDEARADAVDHLRTRFGIEVIAPVISTPFDPLIHEDSPTTRLTPPNPNLAHTIYARVGLGLRRGDEVIEKAWVKRYAGYEAPAEARPAHAEPEVADLPTPYPSPVPKEGNQIPDPQIAAETGDNAAKSLLQQAAEHAD